MKLRIDGSNSETAEQVRQVLRYNRAVFTAHVAEARVRVDACTDALGQALVRCRLQLRQSDGELIKIEELQPTLDLAVTRALARGISAVKRRQRLGRQVA